MSYKPTIQSSNIHSSLQGIDKIPLEVFKQEGVYYKNKLQYR